MRCFTACFGSSKASYGSHEDTAFCKNGASGFETRLPTKPTEVSRNHAELAADRWDWDALVPLLTGDAAQSDWWEILQSATTALTERLSADHASIYMVAGAGVAALSVAGVPLFGARLGQLLLPGACQPSCCSSDDDRSTNNQAAGAATAQPAVDLTSLAAALQDQTAPVPTLVHTALQSSGRQREAPAAAPGASASTSGIGRCTRASDPGSSHRHSGAGAQCKAPLAVGSQSHSGPSGEGQGPVRRHFLAVGIPGGKALAGMLLLSVKGVSPPKAWQQSSGPRTLAALLAPLLRPPRMPLARRTLAELLAASTINDLVRLLHGAASELLAQAVRVSLVPRVALLRNDGTTAAVFSVAADASGGTSTCRRRSKDKDVVVVDTGGSSHRPASRPQDFFMTVQPQSERDSLGPATIGTPGGGTGVGLGVKGFMGGEPSLPRFPGTAGMSCGASSNPVCRGQSLPLQHTLLSEALSRGSGLCISDCNAYVQDSKAYPRDLVLFKGAAPPQSLALATSCHCGRPLLALYATYHSILPQGLLQAVVHELGQLLRAVTPTVASLLIPRGPMSDEWIYLHDYLLAPQGPYQSGHGRQQRISSNTGGANNANGPAAAAAATTGRTSGAEGGAVAGLTTPTAAMSSTPPVRGSSSRRLRTEGAVGGGGAAGGGSPMSGGPLATAATATACCSADGGRCGGTMPGGIASAVAGAMFPRPAGAASVASCCGGAYTAACARTGGPCRPEIPEGIELVAVMNAAAAAMTTVQAAGSAEGRSRTPLTPDTGERLAAFVSGGETAGLGSAAPLPLSSLNRGPVGSAAALAGTLTGRTSFSLEAAGSPRGGVRLAPLITTLHDRLKSAQAEQLTSSSRAASRLLDLESLRFLERVGKGGYGSVYRGLYHGAEVAIKVVEDPASSLTHLSNSIKGAEGAPAGSTLLRAKHLHDAIELVASVSMSHPNIVQLITYFVDVRAHQVALRPDSPAKDGEGRRCGADRLGDPDRDTPGGASSCDMTEADGDAVSYEDVPPVQLVHMSSSCLDSTASSFTEPEGNEAIVLVMEYCDRGSLKDAIQGGSFLNKEALSRLQQQQQQQQSSPSGQPPLRVSTALLNMKAVYSTLLEVALALRHMHGLHMVHCDLKPQNVLLKCSPRDPRGFTAKLSDFGLAKMMAHDDEGQLVIDEGIQSGTITHLPPEALQGRRPLGPAVDVYAFGIVMYQVLCGMAVYKGMDVKQMIRGVVRHALRPSFPAWVPAEYRELAQRCWHETPLSRPSSLQLVAELEALLDACDAAAGGPHSRRFGGGIGGGASSIRSAAAGSAAAGSAAAGSAATRRRLPQKCATEAAIRSPQKAAQQQHQQYQRQQRQPATAPPPPPAAPLPPPLALGADAAAAAPAAAATAVASAAAPAAGAASAAAMSRMQSYYLYQPPGQLYHPGVAGGGGGGGGFVAVSTCGDGRMLSPLGSTTGGSMGAASPGGLTAVATAVATAAAAAAAGGGGGGSGTPSALLRVSLVNASTGAVGGTPLQMGGSTGGRGCGARVPTTLAGWGAQPYGTAAQHPHPHAQHAQHSRAQRSLYTRTAVSVSPPAGGPAALAPSTVAPGSAEPACRSPARAGSVTSAPEAPAAATSTVPMSTVTATTAAAVAAAARATYGKGDDTRAATA